MSSYVIEVHEALNTAVFILHKALFCSFSTP